MSGDTDHGGTPETDEPKIDETPTEQTASTDETHETGGTTDPVGE